MELRTVVCLAILCSFPVGNDSSETPGSGCGGTDCMEIPHSNDCRELSGRGTTHSSSQLLSFDIQATENNIENGFLALDILGSQTNAPQACVQLFQYIICLLASPPCDMSTCLPMLLCEETCLAYDRLISHSVCNEMINGVRDIIQEHHERNPEFLDLLRRYYEAFNCSDPATYGYNSTSFTEYNNISCTNLFSPEIQDAILTQSTFLECTKTSSSACQTIYPVEYDITIPGRVEQEVFDIVTDVSSSLDEFCVDVLEVMACIFLHPPCTQEGIQMEICGDQCSTIMKIAERCNFQSKVSNSTLLDPFLGYLQNFNCSDSTTYLIQGVPINGSKCIPLADFFGNTNNEEQSGFSSLPLVLGILFSFFGIFLLSVAISILSCGIYRLHTSRVVRKYRLSLVNRRVNATNDTGLATSFRLIDTRDDLDHFADTPAPRNKSVNSEVPETPATIMLSSADRQKYELLFKELVVHYHTLEITDIIGQGAFGKVHSGSMITDDVLRIGTKVAIKTMKEVHSEEQLRKFLAESLIMKDFHHPHVLGLLGVCFDAPDGSPYIVLPFMANGSLKKYLMGSRVHSTRVDIYPQGLKLSALTKMCLDIAKGMEYLSEHKFVHRDLAARNCMLNEELCVLVGDFGLARDIYSADYYRSSGNSRLPVKWMPPETINDGISDERTDVWSYGVTCWEVFSLGRTPYPGTENHEILDHITSGGRLKKPPLCPEKLYGLMCQCWHYLPEERPTFKEIVCNLQEYWDEEHLYEVQSYLPK